MYIHFSGQELDWEFFQSFHHKQHKEQLEKQGKSRKIIQDLAQNSLRRTELRLCLHQHVVGLTNAIQNNQAVIQNSQTASQNIKTRLQDIDLLKKILNEINEFANHRLDNLDQSSKELLQIVFYIP